MLIGALFAPSVYSHRVSNFRAREGLVIARGTVTWTPLLFTSMAVARPPVLSHLVISRLVLGYFPFKEIETSSVEEFVSYDDRNYFFRGQRLDHYVEKHDSLPSEYVLKVTNSNDSSEIVVGLSGITKHLHKKGYKCPYPIPLSQPAGGGGEYDDMVVLSYEQLVALEKDEAKKVNVEDAKNGVVKKYCVRVLVFVPGELLTKVPQSPGLLFKVGQYIGSLYKVQVINTN